MNNYHYNKSYVVDLYNKSIGRMASVLISVLKKIHNDNSHYTSKIILTNVNSLKIGSKLLNKKYWRHTGYPGGIKFKFGHNFDVTTLFKMILLKMSNRTSLDKRLLRTILMVNDLQNIQHIKDMQYINV
ncbi:50S ribosomal protein L13 [Candidatus Hodgkinia cicadicola]|nr:50S ribosomal protein L13 [Candidatus Hodgkinia cicadicola]